MRALKRDSNHRVGQWEVSWRQALGLGRSGHPQAMRSWRCPTLPRCLLGPGPGPVVFLDTLWGLKGCWVCSAGGHFPAQLRGPGATQCAHL